MRLHNKVKLLALSVCSLALVPAWGALGSLQVTSSLGEPFSGEIAVTGNEASVLLKNGIGAATLTGQRLQLRAVPSGNHVVLRVTSSVPVKNPVFSFGLSVGSQGRQYTALLDPPGYRAHAATPTGSAPATKPAPAPQRRNTPVAGKKYTVSPGETLHGIAAQVRPQGLTVEQTMRAIVRANPRAFRKAAPGTVYSGTVLFLPSEARMKQLAVAPAAAAPIRRPSTSPSVRAGVPAAEQPAEKTAAVVAQPAPQAVPSVEKPALAEKAAVTSAVVPSAASAASAQAVASASAVESASAAAASAAAEAALEAAQQASAEAASAAARRAAAAAAAQAEPAVAEEGGIADFLPEGLPGYLLLGGAGVLVIALLLFLRAKQGGGGSSLFSRKKKEAEEADDGDVLFDENGDPIEDDGIVVEKAEEIVEPLEEHSDAGEIDDEELAKAFADAGEDKVMEISPASYSDMGHEAVPAPRQPEERQKVKDVDFADFDEISELPDVEAVAGVGTAAVPVNEAQSEASAADDDWLTFDDLSANVSGHEEAGSGDQAEVTPAVATTAIVSEQTDDNADVPAAEDDWLTFDTVAAEDIAPVESAETAETELPPVADDDVFEWSAEDTADDAYETKEADADLAAKLSAHSEVPVPMPAADDEGFAWLEEGASEPEPVTANEAVPAADAAPVLSFPDNTDKKDGKEERLHEERLHEGGISDFLAPEHQDAFALTGGADAVVSDIDWDALGLDGGTEDEVKAPPAAGQSSASIAVEERKPEPSFAAVQVEPPVSVAPQIVRSVKPSAAKPVEKTASMVDGSLNASVLDDEGEAAPVIAIDARETDMTVPLQAKLELAKMYLETDDAVTARKTLHELVDEANGEILAEAQSLLQSLGG